MQPVTAPTPSFEYEGTPELLPPIAAALASVVDPEVGLAITELGLVYRVRLEASHCAVEMTMTSAACPMGELIMGDVRRALAAVLPPGEEVGVALVWEPPFGVAFYLPLAALHATLLWRVLAAPLSGALANALALLWFALTVPGAVLAARAPGRAHAR